MIKDLIIPVVKNGDSSARRTIVTFRAIGRKESKERLVVRYIDFMYLVGNDTCKLIACEGYPRKDLCMQQ